MKNLIFFLLALILFNPTWSKQITKPATCSSEKLGTIIGVSSQVVATLSPTGKILPAKYPCDRKQIMNIDDSLSLMEPISLSRPISFVGLNQGKSVQFNSSAISPESECAEKYYICSDKKTCKPEFSGEFFITKMPGKNGAMKKINSDGVLSDVSEKTWSLAEGELRRRIQTGYSCFYSVDKGVAGQRVHQGVQKIKLSKNKKARIISLGLKTTDEKGSETVVYGVKFIPGNGMKETEMKIFCGSADVPKEITSLLAVEYDSRTLILTRLYTEDYLISMNPASGKVIDQRSISNGQAECD